MPSDNAHSGYLYRAFAGCSFGRRPKAVRAHFSTLFVPPVPMPLNVEIKAPCKDLEHIHGLLVRAGADFQGTDRQVDQYFEVPEGRLKLRRGPIENSLIFYRRAETTGPKTSEVALYHPEDPATLADVLIKALPVWVTVDKERRIYFHGNVKFHLDRVSDLGDFVEIEAIDRDGTHTHEDLAAQCGAWMTRLGIRPEDGVPQSYSDMLAGERHRATHASPQQNA